MNKRGKKRKKYNSNHKTKINMLSIGFILIVSFKLKRNSHLEFVSVTVHNAIITVISFNL